MIMYRMTYQEAAENGGLAINPTGMTFYLFKALGITGSERRDLLLKVNGDLSKFEEICQIIASLDQD